MGENDFGEKEEKKGGRKRLICVGDDERLQEYMTCKLYEFKIHPRLF